MKYIDEFIALMEKLNPNHEFTEDEKAFLKKEFYDLRAFVENLGDRAVGFSEVTFADVLKDEVFYYRGTQYCKMDERTARKMNTQDIQEFMQLEEIRILKTKD